MDGDYTLDQICDDMGICITTLQKLRTKLNLPNRKRQSTYEKDAFIAAYNTGLSNCALGTIFCMERRTVQKRIQELGLLPRKHVSSSYENEFREAHGDGLTVPQLANKFHLSRSQVYVYMRKFRLSYVKERKTSVVGPLMNPLEPVRSQKKDKAKESIKAKVTEPDEVPEVHENRPHFNLPPPTLRQLEKRNREIAMQRAQRDFKIRNRENGYGSLIKEIDNQITSPFTR
jgi:transposase